MRIKRLSIEQTISVDIKKQITKKVSSSIFNNFGYTVRQVIPVKKVKNILKNMKILKHPNYCPYFGFLSISIISSLKLFFRCASDNLMG